jgi:Raf kinase inhibitor-like YbhB/YbcL family protein
MDETRESIKRSGCLLAMLLLCGCAAGSSTTGGDVMTLSLKSPAFLDEGDIPQKHACDGADLSPALSWNDPPAGTQSFSLIMDDPDAPGSTWVHWVLFNVPKQVRALPEGVPKYPQLKDGSRHGRNDFKVLGYGGPCPPRGPAHRYYFKLYALDANLDLTAGASKADVEKAMKGHILAQGQLVGRYKR